MGYPERSEKGTFLPGHKGISPGRHKLPEEIRYLSKELRDDVIRKISQFSKLSFGLVLECLERSTASSLDSMICSLIKKVVIDGDIPSFNALMDRSIGKPKEYDDSAPEDPERERLSKMNLREIIKLIQDTEKDNEEATSSDSGKSIG